MEVNTIRIAGDDEWSVMNLYRFLHAMNILYNRLYVFKFYIEEDYESLRELLDNSLYYIDYEEALFVDRIVIESPAEINLKGSGEVLREIREFIKDISFRNRIEREKLETELMREKVTLLKELGYTDEEIRSIISKFISPLRTIQNQIEINDLFLIEDKDDE